MNWALFHRQVLTFMVSLSPTKLMPSSPNSYFVVWDVGQGSFSTLITERSCLHIDAGGSKKPRSLLLDQCQHKNNTLLFTHYDRDHYSLVPYLKRKLPHLCTLSPGNKRLKKRYRLPVCTLKQFPAQMIYKSKWKKRNESHAYLFQKKIFITGDSPRAIEKRIAIEKCRELRKVRFYVVGHHGSNTSSSKQLLGCMSSTVQALVSAKKRTYGHPHPKVLSRLRKKKIPVASTEIFGHLIFEWD